MTPEIKAALERYRENKYRETETEPMIEVYEPRQKCFDRELLADAYLAEHPPFSGGVEVTADEVRQWADEVNGE